MQQKQASSDRVHRNNHATVQRNSINMRKSLRILANFVMVVLLLALLVLKLTGELGLWWIPLLAVIVHIPPMVDYLIDRFSKNQQETLS